ncbi:valine--pyruvate aminotransferase [Methylohalomonas lacus]|uniref:Valine--pyruvate aminotransferase n=1 Tax=Methylohalomonas lacus TaxID=398773 RepID=A0AAE3HM39_9GAMM|nr:valine--pyruvate transaminase [Methylohalomonas lacus]MCS3903798.1 valine--pyruvate aminotransferase [Methylohalomonas lacus]
MQFSSFSKRFMGSAGILQLMQDLGEAMANGGEDVCMLGGGNPAAIPEINERLHRRMQALLDEPNRFAQMIGNYDSPQGEPRFIKALCELFRREYGWAISERNIALTAGSQAAFFMLFNLFAGAFPDGGRRRILLPILPEYIGYSDVGISQPLFRAVKPSIEERGAHRFKYRVNFDELTIADDVGAICVSRPTNPTGNVLTDDEIDRLHALAREHDVPLIIDNAYGQPFPDIIFKQVALPWSEQIILCLSLSKMGLPAVRTGIIVAAEPVIQAITGMNAILQLANGSIGPALAEEMTASGEIIELSRNVINPYYRARSEQALAWFDAALAGVDYRIHEAEGAIFLWLWFPGLPISSDELYRRLKQRGVLVIAGEHFFPGLEEDWPHRHECIRVSYAQSPEVVQRGIGIIAEEVKKAFGHQD